MLKPVPRTNIDCLDEARLQNYLKNIIKDPEVPQTQAE
jgi:ATP-dependent DNA helicase RecG